MSLASLAQLDRSHRRHDDVMSQLLEAARRLAAGRPHDTDIDVVRDAVAYFERAVTRHFLDEEGSVFPRLSTRRPELAEALASLSAEHPAQIALQNAVAECVKQLDGESRPGAGKALLEVAERLAEQHRMHVEREDEIFRGAHEALTAQDDADIVAEMETRRDRDSEENGRMRSGGGGGEGRGMGGGGRGRGMGGGGGGRGRNRDNSETRQTAANASAKGSKATAPKSGKAARNKNAAKSAKPTKSAKATKSGTAARNASAAKRAKVTKSPTARKRAKPTKRTAKTARATAKAKPSKAPTSPKKR